MSKINYQALREAAEKATWGDWDSYKPHRGARGYEVRLSSQAIAQHVLKNNAEFIAAFNPKIALALLDERERNQQYIKSRDQENEDIALTVGRLRVELEGKDSKIANLTAERDALREGEMGDARHSNTRAAADIYFQLVEECEIPAGGSRLLCVTGHALWVCRLLVGVRHILRRLLPVRPFLALCRSNLTTLRLVVILER